MKSNYTNTDYLISRLEKGDEKAYMYIVDTYHSDLFDYAKNLSRDHYRADDIVQNVFIGIWEKRTNFKKVFSLKKYLYKSVYNEFIDLYRKDVATTNLEKKYIEETDLYLGHVEENELTRLIDIVKREIELLPPKCKETFLLSRMEGLSYVEIADYMKVSIKTVETHMSNAFRILREKIDKKGHTLLFLLFGNPLKLYQSLN